MRYLSVCSGIEAATVAWHHMGWQPVAFSDIEPFPSAVLAHHYPHVPNFGDMTKFEEWDLESVDLLVGGTPCQSFSVAGLRKGLADPRGNLMLTFLAIAQRHRPRWIVWENVPGVLSSNGGRDFGTFLGALGELGYGFAYRVLDAQWFGVAQRRRRVFVVGYLGDWQRPAKVLFESESVRRDTAPSREARKDTSASPGASTYLGNAEGGSIDVPFMTASSQMRCINNQTPLVGVTHALTASGSDASEDGTGRGVPLIPISFGANMVAQPVAFTTEQTPKFNDDCALTLTKQSPTGGGQPQCVSVAMQVRRLTPVECERLQGFPDGYTNIPWRKKDEAPDGPRYKALGNSMAVPVMRWIGERIAKVDAQ